MSNNRILGITLCVVGTVLLALGYRASGTPVDQITDAFTGSYTNRTTFYLVAGIAGLVSGGFLATRGTGK